MVDTKRTGGRPTRYKSEYTETAYKLALLGCTDDEMADIIGVAPSTFQKWKKEHRGFSESITRGKDIADANVAERLYKRAMGYEHEDVYPSSFQGEVTLTPIRKYYPPDTQAASLWLRNRQKNRWRDKQEHEHTGKDGQAIDLNLTLTEKAARAAALFALAEKQKAEAEGDAGG